MAYPENSKETTENGVKFVETAFSVRGPVSQALGDKELLVKVNTETGAADFYYRSIGQDRLIASTDAGNNWNVKDPKMLDAALLTAPRELVNTPQKREEYFTKNFTYQLNKYRSQILNTTSPTGNDPAFTNTPGYGNNPLKGADGSISQAPPSGTGGLVGSIFGVLQGGLPEFDFTEGKVPNPAAKGENRPLKYPFDLDVKQDTLHITMIEYQSPYTNIFDTDAFTRILKEGVSRTTIVKGGGKDTKTSLKGRVILPVPNSASDTNSVAWVEDNMDAVTAAMMSKVVNETGPITAGVTLSKILGEFLGSDLIKEFPKFAAYLKIAGSSNPDILKSAVQSLVLNRLGFEVSPESILGRGRGVVPNSNLQLLFNNVTLRSFNFAYMMSPRSEKEATRVNDILRFFKQGMAAKKQQAGAGAASLVLGTPDVFKLEYKTGDNSIKGLNKFKICALTSFNVNYAPTGQWAAYAEGQPASVIMTMGFREIEPIYESDYQNNRGLYDVADVADDDIGY